MSNITSIISKIKNELSGGIPFMEGREKADVTLNTIYTITDYGYLKAEDGEYIVFVAKENDKNFYFGGSVITNKMKELEMLLSKEELEEILSEGIEVIFNQKVSKNKRKYTTVEFFPNN